MVKIKLIDNSFSHGKTTTDLQVSNFIEWERSIPNNDETVVITDNSLYSAKNIVGKKIALLIEPKSINTNIYDWISKNYEIFEHVLTYDVELLSKCKNSIFYPHGGCWILPEDQKIHKKNKLLSIIVSEKKITEGHKLRHEIVEGLKKNKLEFNLYGRGYNPINNKIDALKDYKFSIVVENIKTDYYFTEKIIDCFRTGTIPIYWGCPSIGKFFDTNGILSFNTIPELLNIITNINEEFYLSKMDSIINNFQIANNFLLIEDWIYDKLPILKK